MACVSVTESSYAVNFNGDYITMHSLRNEFSETETIKILETNKTKIV